MRTRWAAWFGSKSPGTQGDSKVYDQISDRFPADTAAYGVFEGDAWLDGSVAYVKSLRSAAANGSLAIEPYLAPIAMLAVGHLDCAHQVRILDFGGGIGPCVDPILSALGPEANASYLVVDGERNCEIGKSLFADDRRVSFSPAVPASARFDIVMMSGSLQYIADWRSALDCAIASRPAHVYLSRLPLRRPPDRPSAAARQRIHLGSPRKFVGHAWHWIYAAKEIDAFMSDRDYRRGIDLYIRDFSAEIDAEFGPCDMRVRSFALSDHV